MNEDLNTYSVYKKKLFAVSSKVKEAEFSSNIKYSGEFNIAVAADNISTAIQIYNKYMNSILYQSYEIIDIQEGTHKTDINYILVC